MMSGLKFKNYEGDEIPLAFYVVLVALVLPGNLLVLSYLSMLLAGALHSGAPQFPAVGFWSAACGVVLFRVLGWKGPITLSAPRTRGTPNF